MNLKKIATGAFLLSIINIVRLIAQFLSVPILARLLSPEDYGLAAMAMPFILFVMMIADSGIGNSLIRIDREKSQAWDSCFWLSCALGLILTFIIALCAPLTGYILNEPRISSLVLGLSVIILAQTITIVPGAALQQQTKFGIVASTEIIALFAGIGTAVYCAMHGSGVWALVWQQIVFYMVRMTLTLSFSSYRPKLTFHFGDTKEHLLFGWHILGSNLVSFVSRAIENLVIGKVSGPAPVGIYTMAFQFARLPFMLVTGPLQYTIYPHITKLKDTPQKMVDLFLFLTHILAIIVIPSVCMVAASSPSLFHLLLSEKWSSAAPIFALIAPAAAIQPVTAIASTFLMALGRTDIQMRLALQSAALWFFGLMASVWYGISMVAFAYTITSIGFCIWSLYISLPILNCPPRKYVSVLIEPILTTFFAVIVYFGVLQIHSFSPFGNTFIAASICLTNIGFLLFRKQRDIREFLTQIHSHQTA